MNELIDQLQKKGAEIVLYEDDRVVETEFLKISLKHTLIQKGICRKRTIKLLSKISDLRRKIYEDHRHF